jgi:hypothetical protein
VIQRGGSAVYPDLARHDLQVDATLQLVGQVMKHDWRNVANDDDHSAVLRSAMLLLEGQTPHDSAGSDAQSAFTQDICEGVVLALVEYEVAEMVTQLMRDVE